MLAFTPAVKRQAKLRIALIGPSGSGKTYSALSVAQHLANKIALVDTEHGSASKYADTFRFDTLQLNSFHPNHYIEAIDAAEQAGYELLILDSYSHAWAGKDGALELVDREAKKLQSGNKFAAWREVTPLHNNLIEKILSANLHVIATMRAKTEYSQERDDRGRTVIRKVGMGPIQRDQVEYEFDVVGELDQENNLVITKTRCKQLNGAVIPKPGENLATILKAWLTDGAPAIVQPSTPEPDPETYNRQAREIVLKDLRAKIKAAGGTPAALYPKAIETPDKLEYEIGVAKQELDRLELVAKHAAA